MALIGMDKVVSVNENSGMLGGQMRSPTKEQQIAAGGVCGRLFDAVAPRSGE